MIIKQRSTRRASPPQPATQLGSFRLRIKAAAMVILVALSATALLAVGTFLGVAAEREDVLTKLKRVRALDTVRNYWSGLGAQSDHIFIDIKHTDYQKLTAWRQVALERGQITSDLKEAVPAKIRYRDQQMKANIRFKGEWTDHLGANKWSFRIKIGGGDTLWGMKAFSIQHPRTRSYIYEWIYHKALQREQIAAQRYHFITVTVNGRHDGVFAVEEHFAKQLIESNQGREGVILRFNEDFRYEPFSHEPGVTTVSVDTGIADPQSSHPEVYGEGKVGKDAGLQSQYSVAQNLLQALRAGRLPTHKVFDADKLAMYFALSELTGGITAAYDWSDMRLLYNPITSLLEPIGVEGNVNPDGIATIVCAELADPAMTFHRRLFEDQVFFRKYVQAIEKVSQPAYLDELLAEIGPELTQQLRIIHSEWPYWPYDPRILKKNSAKLRAFLNPNKGLHAYLHHRGDDSWEFELAAIQTLPIEITRITAGPVELVPEPDVVLPGKLPREAIHYERHRFTSVSAGAWSDEWLNAITVHYRLIGSTIDRVANVFPHPRVDETRLQDDPLRRDANHIDFPFLITDENAKTITISAGQHQLDRSLILPSGYRVVAGPGAAIDLVKSAMIISSSPLSFVGDEVNPVRIFSSDGSGQGLTVLKATDRSSLRHVSFRGLKNPNENGWTLTGAVTFYESPVNIRECEFLDNNSEDSLNIVRCSFLIDQCLFQNSPSDAFDGDFVTGTVQRSSFIDIQGDCVDVSGSQIKLTDIFIRNAGDKGISLGEGSTAHGERIAVTDSRIGVAAKDLSDGVFKHVRITKCDIGLAVFQKKPEYGAGRLEVTKLTLDRVKTKFIIEEGSRIILDEEDRRSTHATVKELLYDSIDAAAAR